MRQIGPTRMAGTEREFRAILAAAACVFAALAAFPVSSAPQTSGSAGAAATPLPTLPPLPPLPPLTGPGETATVPSAQLPTPEQPAAGTAGPGPPPTAAPPSAPNKAAPRTAEPSSPSEGLGGIPSNIVILLGVGLLVLVATLVVVLAVILKKPVVINVPSRSAAQPPPPLPEGPAPAAWEGGNVARTGRPPEGTLEVLPGRFALEDGDEKVEIRIFRTSPGDRVETTIGREEGPAYRHIQLLASTVSTKQAKLVFDRGSYSIINYARTNPTKVNGEDLEENASRRLLDEDRFEIGGISITYHES